MQSQDLLALYPMARDYCAIGILIRYDAADNDITACEEAHLSLLMEMCVEFMVRIKIMVSIEFMVCMKLG